MNCGGGGGEHPLGPRGTFSAMRNRDLLLFFSPKRKKEGNLFFTATFVTYLPVELIFETSQFGFKDLSFSTR